MLGTEPLISTDTDVSRGASADLASVEMPQMTQCQYEFMAVLCMNKQIKVDVSKSSHVGIMNKVMVFQNNLTCFWNNVGLGACFPARMSVRSSSDTNVSDVEVDARCPLSDAMSFGASVS
jgi:hypothetical protein